MIPKKAFRFNSFMPKNEFAICGNILHSTVTQPFAALAQAAHASPVQFSRSCPQTFLASKRGNTTIGT